MEPTKSIQPAARVFVFIDASNIWQAQKSKGKMFDYGKLQEYLRQTYVASEIRIFYYTAYPANGTRGYDLDKKHKFFTYLKKALGFTVRKKPLKQIHIQNELGHSVMEKGNMDVEMAIDIVHYIEQYDVAILFTGDSDFLAVVNYIKNRQKKVYVYSSKNNVARELRTAGSGYMDILELQADIWRAQQLHHKK